MNLKSDSVVEWMRSPDTWRETSALLDEALELDKPAREAWLQALYKSDPRNAGLIARILSEEAVMESGSFLKRPAAFQQLLVSGMRDDAAPAASGEAPVENERFGPYRVLRELGRGGMGVVWLATRADGGPDRPVAIKTLQNIGSRIDMAERFRREGNILARLEHPGIARLYDAGTSDSGQPYLVLQYVEGLPITEYCAQRRLTLRQRVELFGKVLDAVAYAHEQRVMHRDLKPSNILVTADAGVRLLDFGIAKLIEAEAHSAPETELTYLGGKALTLEYASPEQVRGDALTLATDTYSLGVILYELLTGRRPHQAQRPSRAALEEAILQGEIAWPGNALPAEDGDVSQQRRGTPAQLRRQLRGDLDAIVMTALARAPGERYASVTLLAADLQAWLQGQPVRARPESRLARGRRFVRRYRMLVGASLAVTAALVAGVAMAWWQAGLARESQAVAQRESARAQAQAARADAESARARAESAASLLEKQRADSEATRAVEAAGAARQSAESAARNLQLARRAQTQAEQETANATATKKFLLDLLRRNSTEQADPRKAQQVTVRELLDEGTTRVLAGGTLTPATRIELLGTLRELHTQLGLDARAEELARKTIDIARSIDDGKNHALLNALVSSLTGLRHSGNPKERERLLAETAAVISATPDVSPTLQIEYHLQSSFFLRERDARKAEQEGRRALDLIRRHAPDGPNHARAVDNLGRLLQQRGAHADAIPFLDEGIAALRRVPNAETRLIQPLANRAVSLTDVRRLADAERDLREALAIARAKLGEDHVDTFHIRSRLGNFLSYDGRFADAVVVIDGLVDRVVKALGREERYHLPIIANNAAIISRAFGDLDRAATQNNLALELWSRHDPNTRNHAIALREKANQLSVTGPPELALALYEESITIDRTARGQPFIGTLYEYARQQLRNGNASAARSALAEVDLQLPRLSPVWRLGKPLIEGEFMLAEGKADAAFEQFRSTLEKDRQANPPLLAPPTVLNARIEMGAAGCRTSGHIAEGTAALVQAIADAGRMGTLQHPAMIRARLLLADCYRRAQRHAEADSEVQTAQALARRHARLAPFYTALLPAATADRAP